MIKTKDGMTKAVGTNDELLIDFVGTAESLLRRTKITAEQLHKAVKLAEMTVKLMDQIGAFFEDEVQDYEPAEEEDEAEEVVKIIAKKNGVKVATFEADDMDEMLEWLKGELENLEEEADD